MADADYQTEQEIIRLEYEWIEAIAQRDAAALNRVIADEFLIAGWLPNGQLGDKHLYVTASFVRRVKDERGTSPAVDELIRIRNRGDSY